MQAEGGVSLRPAAADLDVGDVGARALQGDGMRSQWVDWVALYVFMFGVWPLADPHHNADSLMSLVDLALHIGAAIVLLARWKMVRR